MTDFYLKFSTVIKTIHETIGYRHTEYQEKLKPFSLENFIMNLHNLSPDRYIESPIEVAVNSDGNYNCPVCGHSALTESGRMKNYCDLCGNWFEWDENARSKMKPVGVFRVVNGCRDVDYLDDNDIPF